MQHSGPACLQTTLPTFSIYFYEYSKNRKECGNNLLLPHVLTENAMAWTQALLIDASGKPSL